MTTLRFSLAFLVASALIPGCILTWDESLLEQCDGCFDGERCLPGTELDACGANGESCQVCNPGLACEAGACGVKNAVSTLALGWSYSCAATRAGALWCWGENAGGQLGLGTGGDSVARPTQVVGQSFSALAGGDKGTAHSCGIQPDDSLWCWGDGGDGKLGLGSSQSASLPERVGTASWLAIGLGDQYSCGLQTNGSLWCWGWSAGDRLGGLGTTHEPKIVDQRQYQALAVGVVHACAIETDGTLRCWGNNSCSQLGRSNVESPPTPTDEQAGGWSAISAGECHSCGIRSGALFCFGSNGAGQLGVTGVSGDTPTPTPVETSFSDFVEIASGAAHNCALRTDHSLWCWGDNTEGALGIGAASLGQSVAVVQRVEGDDWAHVFAGRAHTCAIKLDGSLWCWGSASHQQLGLDDGRTLVQDPARVPIGE